MIVISLSHARETGPTPFRHLVGARSDRRIVVDGLTLAFDDVGHGPALVCLHAIGHGAGDYARLAGALSDRYRVIALDWPGHGASLARFPHARLETFAGAGHAPFLEAPAAFDAILERFLTDPSPEA